MIETETVAKRSRILCIWLYAATQIAYSQTANLRPDAQPPEDPKTRAEAVRLLELAVQASTPTSATNMQLVTLFHLGNPGPGELADGEHIVTVGPNWKMRRNEWIIGATHTVLVRNGDKKEMLTPWAPLPTAAELIEEITPIDLALFDRTDVIHSITAGPDDSQCIVFDTIAGERQQPGEICIDRRNHWLLSKKVGDTLTVNSKFVPFDNAFMPTHIERYVGNVLRFVFDQTVTPMTSFPPDFFSVSDGTKFRSLDATCQEFRAPRPLHAPQPEPLSSAPVVTDIRVKAMIGPKGEVLRAEPADHVYPDLNERAVQIVSGWTFTAPYCDGKTITIGTTVTVEFKGR